MELSSQRRTYVSKNLSTFRELSFAPDSFSSNLSMSSRALRTNKIDDKSSLHALAKSAGLTATGAEFCLDGPDYYLLEDVQKIRLQTAANERTRECLKVYAATRPPPIPINTTDFIKFGCEEKTNVNAEFSNPLDPIRGYTTSAVSLTSSTSTDEVGFQHTTNMCAPLYKNIFLHNGSGKKRQKNNINMNFLSKMHNEIIDLLIFLTPTRDELYCKSQALLQLELISKCLFKTCRLQIFGSYYTGLALPGSDIDVCLMDVEGDSRTNLKLLALHLCKLQLVHGIEVITTARVPIVKFVDFETGTQLDVSINQESALATSNFVKEQLDKFVHLRPLLILIKLFLFLRGLGETYKGGVGSYLLFCMVLNFLQLHESSSNQEVYDRTLTSKLLIDFFFYWGFQKDIQNESACVRGLGHVFPKDLRPCFMIKPHLLSMESPLEPEVDIGKNSFHILQVKTAFQHAWMSLMSMNIKWVEKTGKQRDDECILSALFDCEHPIFWRKQPDSSNYQKLQEMNRIGFQKFDRNDHSIFNCYYSCLLDFDRKQVEDNVCQYIYSRLTFMHNPEKSPPILSLTSISSDSVGISSVGIVDNNESGSMKRRRPMPIKFIDYTKRRSYVDYANYFIATLSNRTN